MKKLINTGVKFHKGLLWAFILYSGVFPFITGTLMGSELTLKKTQAGRLFTSFEFEKAVGLYSEILKNHPREDDVLVNRGRALNKLGRFKEAYDDFTQALQIEPKNQLAARYLLQLERDHPLVEKKLELNPFSTSTLPQEKPETTVIETIKFKPRLELHRFASQEKLEQLAKEKLPTAPSKPFKIFDLTEGEETVTQNSPSLEETLFHSDPERTTLSVSPEILPPKEGDREKVRKTNGEIDGGNDWAEHLLNYSGEVRLLLYRGRRAILLKNFSEAETSLRKVLLLDPANPLAISLLGSMGSKPGDLKLSKNSGLAESVKKPVEPLQQPEVEKIDFEVSQPVKSPTLKTPEKEIFFGNQPSVTGSPQKGLEIQVEKSNPPPPTSVENGSQKKPEELKVETKKELLEWSEEMRSEIPTTSETLMERDKGETGMETVLFEEKPEIHSEPSQKLEVKIFPKKTPAPFPIESLKTWDKKLENKVREDFKAVESQFIEMENARKTALSQSQPPSGLWSKVPNPLDKWINLKPGEGDSDPTQELVKPEFFNIYFPKTSLLHLLKAITSRGGIYLKTPYPLDEIVSFQGEELTLEKALENALELAKLRGYISHKEGNTLEIIKPEDEPYQTKVFKLNKTQITGIFKIIEKYIRELEKNGQRMGLPGTGAAGGGEGNLGASAGAGGDIGGGDPTGGADPGGTAGAGGAGDAGAPGAGGETATGGTPGGDTGVGAEGGSTSGGPTTVTGLTSTIGPTSLLTYPQTNSLIVMGPRSRIEKIEKFMVTLGVQSLEDAISTKVYTLKYLDFNTFKDLLRFNLPDFSDDKIVQISGKM